MTKTGLIAHGRAVLAVISWAPGLVIQAWVKKLVYLIAASPADDGGGRRTWLAAAAAAAAAAIAPKVEKV